MVELDLLKNTATHNSTQISDYTESCITLSQQTKTEGKLKQAASSSLGLEMADKQLASNNMSRGSICCNNQTVTTEHEFCWW